MNKDKLEELTNLLQRGLGVKNQLEVDLREGERKLLELKWRYELLKEAQAFLQLVAQTTQNQLKLKIEDIVNLSLNTVFPNEYNFKLEFTVSRGKTDAELLFTSKRTGKEIDPLYASGGGVVDVIAFSLRIASYVLESGIDNVIILDEPFRFISRDLQSRVGTILKTLSERLNLQVIMVTHIEDMINIADRVFEVKKDSSGVSRIITKI